MQGIQNILGAKSPIYKNNIDKNLLSKNTNNYDKKYNEFKFGIECSCSGDFEINYIVGVQICNLQFKFEKVFVPVKFLESGYFHVNAKLNCNNFTSCIRLFKDSYDKCTDSHEFYNIESFQNGLEQCSSYIKDISNIKIFQSLLNGLYILTRQYNTDSLAFKSKYLSENNAGLQGYFDNDKIFITKSGVARSDFSDVVGKQYVFKVSKTSLGILKQDSLFLKKIDNGKPIYTSSFERSLKINISEYLSNYEELVNYYNSIKDFLSIQKNIELEIIVNPITIQVETDKFLKNLHLPFPNSKIASFKKIDSIELDKHSDVLSVTYSFIEIYKDEKFIGYVQGYNSKTYEVRKTSLISNRLEWKTDNKLKCCNEECTKIQELLSKLSSSDVNNCYRFKIGNFVIDKFILANELK